MLCTRPVTRCVLCCVVPDPSWALALLHHGHVARFLYWCLLSACLSRPALTGACAAVFSQEAVCI